MFFFFQAEDGIRDLTVTGVQTCALPIARGVALVHQLHRGGVWDDRIGASLKTQAARRHFETVGLRLAAIFRPCTTASTSPIITSRCATWCATSRSRA